MKKLLALLLMVPMVANAAEPAPGLLYEQGYELSSLWPQYLEANHDCYPNAAYPNIDSFGLSTKYKNEGSKSLRNELHGNIRLSNCGINDGYEEFKVRQEVFWGKGLPGIFGSGDDLQYNFPQGSEYWIGNAYYFPSDEGSFSSWWPKSDLHSIFQIHGSGNGNSPEVFVRIGKSGKINIQNRWTTAVGAAENVETVETHSFVPDQWNSIVVQFKRNCDANGLLKVWVNGVLSMNRENTSVCIKGMPRGFTTGGAYIGYAETTPVRNEIYVHYEDSFRLWRGAGGSYAAVDPLAVGPPPPPPLGLVVNSGNPITDNQDPIYFTAQGAQSITTCGINDAEQTGAKWDYVGATGGKFAGGDIDVYTSKSGTVTCYNEGYTYIPSLSTSSWTSANTVDSAFVGDAWGYTSGLTITKNATATNADGYASLGASIPTVKGDRARFDITYSCTGASCNDLYFDIADELNAGDDRIRVTGTAGALTLTSLNGGHGTTILHRNYTLGDDTYRVSVLFTVTPDNQQYRLRAGWKNSVAVGSVLNLHEVVFRKNWSTTPMTAAVTLDLADTTPPDVANCSLTNQRDSDGAYTARILCDATEPGGQDYVMITDSDTNPSIADVKAGTGSIWAASALAATDKIDFEAPGMSYQDLWGWIVRCDAATVPNCSAVSGVTFDDGVGPGQAKKIKFPAGSRLRRGGVEYTGTAYLVALYASNPLLVPRLDPIATWSNQSFTDGNFTVGALTGGAVNDLQSGTDYYLTITENDGDPYWVVKKQIVVE